MTPRRQYLGTLALLASGGVLGLASASRPWGSARMSSSLEQATETSVSGGDLLPLAPAVCLVAMAAVVAVPAVRRLGRRVVGSVLAAVGVVLAVAAVLAVSDLEGRVRNWIADSPGLTGSVDDVSVSPWWPVALAVAGLMVLTAGVLIVVRGPGWPSMGARYERPAPVPASAASDETGAEATVSDDTVPDPRHAWDALDRGDDPT